MSIAPAGLALAATLFASPTAAASFEDLTAKAQRLDALEPFLARYVGRCNDPFERAPASGTLPRRAERRRRLAVWVPTPPRLPDRRRRQLVLPVTPFRNARARPQAAHAPDAEGHLLSGSAGPRADPDGTMEMDLRRCPDRRDRAEIVFRPRAEARRAASRATWRRRRPVLAIRILDARTGKEIASRTL
jgi:hypothetical protein